MEHYEKIIMGAGLYGLYAALFCGQKKQKVLVLECDRVPFSRATYINQARVHQGYHYPRSISTAMKSAGYFARFNKDYGFCINREFDKVYATSSQYSWSDGEQFKNFCKAANIPCEELHPERFFKDRMCDGAFLTREYTYDAMILKDYLLSKIEPLKNIEIKYGITIECIRKFQDEYAVYTNDGMECRTGFLLNATYAGTNQVLDLAGYEKFGIKYELCEIILCKPSEKLKDIGITVMDGPFFSIMPFGKTGLHSLTAVTFTPHITSYDVRPSFSCQSGMEEMCSPENLGNCSTCPHKPESAWPYMSHLADKYMKPEYTYGYVESLYSMKPILKSSEVDDSRPTAIRVMSRKPAFVSVLSGKINTVYDLDGYLTEET